MKSFLEMSMRQLGITSSLEDAVSVKGEKGLHTLCSTLLETDEVWSDLSNFYRERFRFLLGDEKRGAIYLWKLKAHLRYLDIDEIKFFSQNALRLLSLHASIHNLSLLEALAFKLASLAGVQDRDTIDLVSFLVSGGGMKLNSQSCQSINRALRSIYNMLGAHGHAHVYEMAEMGSTEAKWLRIVRNLLSLVGGSHD